MINDIDGLIFLSSGRSGFVRCIDSHHSKKRVWCELPSSFYESLFGSTDRNDQSDVREKIELFLVDYYCGICKSIVPKHSTNFHIDMCEGCYGCAEGIANQLGHSCLGF